MLEPDLAQPDVDRLLDGGALDLIRLCVDPGLQSRLQLLPQARDAAEERRVGIGDMGEHLRHLRTTCDRGAPHHCAVMAESPIGDVRVGKEGHHRPPGARPGNRVDPAALGHLIGVCQLDSLWRAGGARRVDQRQQVIRLDRAPGLVKVEALGTRRALQIFEREPVAARAVDHDQMLDTAG